MNPIIAHLLGPLGHRDEKRDYGVMSWQQLQELNAANGRFYSGNQFGYVGREYTSLASDVYERNGPVAALIFVRSLVLSDVRFQWQNLSNGPGDLFGSPDLAILEKPWPNATTRNLLSALELDGSLAGNAYYVRERSAFRNEDVLTRLDPCKVTILTGDVTELGSDRTYGKRLVGYAYTEQPGSTDAVMFLPDEVAHYKPLPSRDMPQFKGQSWLSAVLQDAVADCELTDYKSSFLRNSAVPNMIVSFDPGVSVDQFQSVVSAIESRHAGPWNAYKTMYLGGGAHVTTVGSDFSKLNLHSTQGAGETRLAAAAGVPVTIVGFSEGLAGSALNAGNYGSSRRRFADGTIRPMWSEACGALSTIVKPPNGARLWYDDRGCSFLQEDVKDEAEILQTQASTMQILVNSGWKKDSIKAAMVAGGDWSLLVDSGLNSVQLQPPGASTPAPTGGQQP